MIRFLVTFFLPLIIYNFSGCGFALAKPVVAITQIAPHPSLDAIRRGIMDELLTQGHLKPDSIIYENPHGNMATATQIAHKFVSLKPEVIVAITTPSAQTVYNVAKNHHIPVFFGAVSDPGSARLIAEGITGVSDLSPIDQQVDLMRTILPDLKKVGVIYNPGESNSTALITLLEWNLTSVGISLIKSPATNSSEAATAAEYLVGKVQAIYIPNDNTVVSAFESVLKVAKEHKLPIFAADPESVARGAVAAIAHDQYQLGRQTGQMVVRFLKGESLNELPVEYPQKVNLYLNLKAAKELRLTIPSSLIDEMKKP